MGDSGALHRARITPALRGAALATLIILSFALAAPHGASAQPPSAPGFTVTGQFTTDEPPPDAELTIEQAGRIASRDPTVQELSERYDLLRFTVGFVEAGFWQVDYYDATEEDGDAIAQVVIDDRAGTRTETWTGDQVAWRMARGYEGQFGHRLNAPYVWIPLCALFLLGLLDWRRPFRTVHLDLVVLLSFSASHYFFNQAEIGVSVPLVYPVLAYLLARMLWIGFRGGGLGLRPSAPIVLLAVLTVALLGGRVALNLTSEGSVIDVGYAGVIGADRIASGEQVWDAFPDDNHFGDTYGPANYFAYVPFEAAFPWSGEWDELPAARAAAISFDLATVAGLFFLGGRLRPGRGGRALGVTMAFAWTAYPYTAFAIQSSSNDALVAALLVWAMVLFAGPAARGGLLALAGMTKFVPLVLAPLFAVGRRGLLDRIEGDRLLPRSRLRPLAYFSLAFAGVSALMLLDPAMDPGLATFWDRTMQSQLDRESPFSIWGQVGSLDWLQTLVRVLAVGLAVLVAFIPRRRSLPQIAALGAAVLIAVQLTIDHWFYLYIPWFLPLLLAALAWRQPDPLRPLVSGVR